MRGVHCEAKAFAGCLERGTLPIALTGLSDGVGTNGSLNSQEFSASENLPQKRAIVAKPAACDRQRITLTRAVGAAQNAQRLETTPRTMRFLRNHQSLSTARSQRAVATKIQTDRPMNPMNQSKSSFTAWLKSNSKQIALAAGICLVATALQAEAQDTAGSKPAKRVKKPDVYDASVPKPTLAGVRYGKHQRNVLDFWKAASSKPTPLVFVIHGGGWTGGSKERAQRFADVAALLDAGISVAAINYRYVSQGRAAGIEPPVKAPLHDAARALQFVRTQAAAWNIDKTRVGAAGGSAGACSSLWLLFHDDLADPTNEDAVARESTRLFCAAVIGAQTSLDPKQMKEWTPNSRYGGHAFGFANFAKFLAGRDDVHSWIAEYSPYALVTADDPPVYLSYSRPPALGKAEKDPTHTANFGVKLKEHCEEIGVPCELSYPGAPGVTHHSPTEFLIAKLKAH